MTDEISYRDAMTELEVILDEIEGDDLDVDLLATKVKRASELVAQCRERITRARRDVDAIVTELEAFATDLETPGDPVPGDADEG